MPTIEERWDKLPTLERTEIARAAGLSGRVGSASWHGMHEMDREALKKWASSDRETKIQEQVWKDAGVNVKHGEFIDETQADPKKLKHEAYHKSTGDLNLNGTCPNCGSAEFELIPSVGGYDAKCKNCAWTGDADNYIAESQVLIPTGEQIKSYERQKREDRGEPEPTQDYLLWVGYASYPTIRSFIEEAERLGVCRRISRVPKDLELEGSRIFLAHDEGETGDAVIFGYFFAGDIEVITYRDGNNGIPEELREIATGITLEQAAAEEERSCGYREDIGAVYLRGSLIILKPYRDYNSIIDPKAHRFRGIKKVDGGKILKGKAKKAPSEIHRIPRSKQLKKKSGEAWTDKEKDILKELLSKFRPWRAMREMSKVSGRSINAVAYQYSKMKKETKEECHGR